MIMTFIFLFNRTLNKLEEEIIKILKV